MQILDRDHYECQDCRKVYDSDTPMTSIDVEVEVIAFPDDTISRMRGDTVEKSGLILSGANSERPFFAYGKVVKLKNGSCRYEWYVSSRCSYVPWTMRNVWGRYIGSDDWSEKSTNKCIKRRKNDERSIVRTSKYNA